MIYWRSRVPHRLCPVALLGRGRLGACCVLPVPVLAGVAHAVRDERVLAGVAHAVRLRTERGGRGGPLGPDARAQLRNPGWGREGAVGEGTVDPVPAAVDGVQLVLL